MDADVRELIQRIHAIPSKSALVVTGGGVSAAGWLLAVPGGSRTILEISIPYASEALEDYLAREPDSYCSATVTRDMALRARERAAFLAAKGVPGEPISERLSGNPSPNPLPEAERGQNQLLAPPLRFGEGAGGRGFQSVSEAIVGIGCTASLRSDRPKRGAHRVHVAWATAAGTVVQSLTLAKEQRDREAEEEVAARLVLNALAEAFGLEQRVALPLLPGETVERQEQPAGLLARFLAGQPAALCVEPDGRLREGAKHPEILLPGSFNPFHEGHRGMASVATKLVVGKTVAFELSVANADKPSLSEVQVRRRMAQFAWLAPLWLTHAPTFLEKSRLFPGVVFVVGIDTALRIVEPRFYGGSAEAMQSALAEIRSHGSRFLVAGRLAGEKFVELGQVQMPEEFRDLFTAIPEQMFRADVSSTQLRAGT